MRPYDLSQKEHKDWNEIFQLQLFLPFMPELNASRFEKSETPDFLFYLDRAIIGIEHTLFSTDLKLLRFERESEEILSRAKASFEAKHQHKLTVRVMWNDLHWNSISREEKTSLPLEIADFVGHHFSGERFSSFDWRYFYAENLRLKKWLSYIDINYLGPDTKSLWASSRSGVIGALSIDRLKEIILKKEEKYANCKKRCDECWLLIFGSGGGMSSMVDFEESINMLSKTEFITCFERVFYFDAFYRKKIELRIKPRAEVSSHRDSGS